MRQTILLGLLGLGTLAVAGPRSIVGAQDLVSPSAGAPLPAGWEGAESISLPTLNRTYRDLVSDFAPIQQGGLTLTLSSPSQTVILKSHRALLRRREDGDFDARLEIELLGKGRVAGDVDFAGQGTRLQDELLIPQQTVVLDGRLRLEAAPELSSYKITALSLPVELEATIHSQMVRGMVEWCDRLSLVPFTRLDCPGFEHSMSRVRVPLPPAGESYLLPWSELDEAGRARLDALLGLAGTAPPPPPPAGPANAPPPAA